MKLVIICGGVGSKMWPLSRANNPKHFAKLLGDKSLFEINWESLRQKYGPEDIFLQTNQVQAQIALKLVPEIIEENVFVEPEMRNQGPATGFAAAQLIKRGLSDEPFMLIQADVLRTPTDKFLSMVEQAGKLALSNNKYITGGVVPDRVVAGVDYLVKGELVSETGGVKIYEVADYIDRTEEDKIKQYLGSDKLLLHTNHTTMTPNNMMAMIKRNKPEWYGPLMAIAEGGQVESEYGKMPPGPIEEATVAEYRNGGALVAECPFEWLDMGTWESVYLYLKREGKYEPAEKLIEIEGKNNYVRSGKTVATIGVSDMVVVETADAILVMRREDSKKVGQVVDWLKEKEKKELL